MRRAAAILASLLGVVGCGPEPQGATAVGDAGPIAPCSELRFEGEPVQRSLLFVMADTLRRDRVGAYGGDARTPRFDAFAEENRLFRAAVTQAPWTKPSIATLFTGLLPSTHRVLSHPELARRQAGQRVALESDVLDEQWTTLAEALQAAGYRTAAFVANPWIRRDLGFAQGFETFDDSFSANTTPGGTVTRAALSWLSQQPDDGRPWFLYAHYMDPHAPYPRLPRPVLAEHLDAIRNDLRPVGPAAAREIADRSRDLQGRPWERAGVPPRIALLELVYDQGVARFDAALGALLDGMESLPGAREAAVVITSDHGEALFQRGWRGHGKDLFDDEVGVPLAARLPGVRGPAEVSCPVGLVDLRATLCDYLGASCPGPDQGVSLLADGRPRYLITEGVEGRPRNRTVRNGRYKLIHRPDGWLGRARPEAARSLALYDVVADPGESRDLLAEGAPEAQPVLDALLPVLEARPRVRGAETPGRRVPLDDAVRRRLEALGYLEPDPPPE